MKIILTVGHSLLKNGYYTSADGRPFGGVLEYTYNKNIVGMIATYLRKAGHTVDTLICPEKTFSKSTEEKAYKVPKVNAVGYDLVAELHLNASKLHNASGCSVLYKSEAGKQIAQKVQSSLSTVFKNNGIQKRDDLYMLNSTKPVAIMLETFFCDSSSDCEKADKTDVALLIAEGIHGGKIAVSGTSDNPTQEPAKYTEDYLFRFRSIVEELNIRKGPGTEHDIAGCIKDKLVYTVVETQQAKDGGIWGRLKSGAGWVNVGANYVNRV